MVQKGASFVNRRMRVIMAIFDFNLAAVMLGATAGAHGVGGSVSAGVLAVACLAIGIRALVLEQHQLWADRSLLVKSLLRTRVARLCRSIRSGDNQSPDWGLSASLRETGLQVGFALSRCDDGQRIQDQPNSH